MTHLSSLAERGIILFCQREMRQQAVQMYFISLEKVMNIC